MSGDSGAVTTVGRDDFFNDPFFKDWWADFDMPFKTVQFNRQISGEHSQLPDIRSLLRWGSCQCQTDIKIVSFHQI